MPWLREAPVRLQPYAEEQQLLVPALAPRIALRVTEAPVGGPRRLAGEGTIGQIMDDLAQLRSPGAESVVLDPYNGDPRETCHPQTGWQALAAVAAHPELKLARWAARELDAATAAETTMYTSCQPCEMCEAAIQRAGLGRVVFALSDEQLLDIRPDSGRPAVPQAGPALLDEVRAVVAEYYR